MLSLRPIARSPAQGGPARVQARPVGAFAKLASHMDIGWDLDGTLIGHPASPLLHRFIRNTPRTRHVLITFRTRERDVSPWSELAAYPDAPGRHLFDDVVFLAPDAVESVARIELATRSGWRRTATDEVEHLEWKGKACRQHGLTALVDDKPRMVAAGCRRFGIDLFHPQDFLPG